MEGNDITPVGAWTSEETANAAIRETSKEFHHMVVAMESADQDQAEEAGIKHRNDFMEDMKRRSDAATTPFSAEQLTDIAEYLSALMKQRQGVPEGMARVLVYSPEALAGKDRKRDAWSPAFADGDTAAKEG